ncbi:MAG TPA: family 16 glycosylhydrolase [Chitinivibrionales bacterium]|nr:family 16 glycosylhydrolase [Chitinivibrionales bacterium]
MTIKSFLLSVLFAACMTAQAAGAGGWKLFWSDEFDSTGFLDPNNWWVRVASPGWVNGEQEAYTAGHDQANANIFVKNGCLIIEARKSGSDITSGRIEGENLQNFEYGRMEARARLPLSKGMWPAFWMEGWDINKGAGWPGAGEIDIMEGKGRLPSWTSGAFHCSAGGPAGNYTLPADVPNFHDAFHTFAIEWSQDSIRWYADTVNFLTMTKSQIPTAPINKNYFFLVNLAVGGGFDGNTDATTIFPESLIVDYVRVYQWDPNVGTGAGPAKAPSLGVKLAEEKTCFTVSLPSFQRYACRVVSVQGKEVISRNGLGKSFKMETGSLAPGVYLITIHGGFGVFTERLVVRCS